LPSSTEALVHLDGLPGEDWEAVLEEILRVDSSVLEVESVSYWRFRPFPSSIICELGYHASGQIFDRGFELRRTDSPGYFEEIRRAPVLAIDDAIHDERTRDIRGYLMDRHIGALLDTAIRVGGHAVGILCHEHRGGPRPWSEQEQHFAFAVGQIVASRLASRARSHAEERERRAALLADVMNEVAESFGTAAAARLAVDRALPTLGEMSTLVAFDGADLRYVMGAHINPQGRALLDDIARRHPPSLDGPSFSSHAIREQQSLLVPNATLEAARSFGLEDAYYKEIGPLNIRSAMAAPFCIRGAIRGAMMFASTFRRYDQEDLKFAERYTQRIGLILENGWLFKKAQEAIRTRDEFLSLASHELRTPLTSLCLFAQTIAREADGLPTRSLAHMGQRMVRQAQRIDRLAERLLSASELGAGAPTIARETLDLSEIVSDVTLAFSGTAAAAGSSLVFTGDEQVIGRVDPVRLEQVLGNLIDNAIKFGMGNPIEVGLSKRDGTAFISVTDHGPGIPAEEQEAIFHRYRRGSTAAGLGGLGLGLHVVREIVESHGGKVRVEAHPGSGSTFTVELPLGGDEASAHGGDGVHPA
jgi:signal transduction histidine kinase